MIPAVFTIPADRPFLDTLVAGLIARAGDDPLAVARHTILLPTRRATRSLREAFLRASGGRPLLLPRLVPVGDLDAEELSLFAEEAADADADLDLPPAVPELHRRLLLTRLVLAWGRAQGSGPHTAGQAAPLAAELARFLDEVQAERRDFAGLVSLVPEDYAEHWQQVLRFLGILTEHWPQALAEIGCLDPAERRNRVLAAQVALWRRSPPPHPVIAAGITGGVPAVADLVATVASLPQGTVVLPGLDRDSDAETWEQIVLDPAHPQHVMARLLARLELSPVDVRPWEAPGEPSSPPARRRLIGEALCPAAASHRWRELQGIDASALDGLLRLDCPGPQEEALAIALLLRERLERPGETAALVTPDRALARRVASELKRWNIEIDDSAGVPLNKTPPGVFLRLVLEAAAEAFAPLPLLALLKHPLAAAGHRPEALRALTRRLEIAALRGPRPAPGLDALREAIKADDADLQSFIATLAEAVEPLVEALAADDITVPRLVAAHVGVAEALAKSDGAAGPQRLWREPAGEAAAQFVSDLLQAAAEFPPLPGRDYPALFEALFAGQVVRPPYGRHPRLFIWGLMEARLQHADLMILGGLNEGVWPPETESDPWLSRPMRRAFGLSPPERRIGVAAHDFAQAMGAREVVLIRAARIEGAPTVPSRWLLRLDTVLRAVGLEGRLGTAREPLAWQALLDQPAERILLSPPEPRPPVAARPRRLSVTEIETWMRDPYAIYARHVLRLKPLDPIDADPGAAERGTFIHAALDAFVRRFPAALPADAEERLVALGRAAFGAALARPGVWAFWWPRFLRIAEWVVAVETERRPLLAAIGSEFKGDLVLDGPEGPFRLVAKADRIERRRDGGLVIVDYKVGAVPASSDVRLGFSPQLPLEAAMAEAGAFAGIDAGAIADLAHWRLAGGDPAGEIKPVAKKDTELREIITAALDGLARLIARFDDERTPYRAWPRPEKAPRYSDYTHLARVKEWLLGAEVGE